MNDDLKIINNKLDALVNSVSTLSDNQNSLKMDMLKSESDLKIDVVRTQDGINWTWKFLTALISMVGILITFGAFAMNANFSAINTKFDMLNQKLDSVKELNSMQIQRDVAKEKVK